MDFNKKGLLPRNVAGLILAAIGLFFIILLGVQLYGFFENQDVKNAGIVLDSIVGKIEALQDGESNEFLIRGVEEWYLVGFEKSQQRPDKCFLESCICVCKNPRDCQEKGICKPVERENVEVFTNPFEGTYSGSGGETFSKDCIALFDKLIEFSVSKTSENLEINSSFAGELGLSGDEGVLAKCEDLEGALPGTPIVPTLGG
jgi:hypothetical protein